MFGKPFTAFPAVAHICVISHISAVGAPAERRFHISTFLPLLRTYCAIIFRKSG